MANRQLSTYKVLSFDVYATLVDWEAGIWRALQPLHDALQSSHPWRDDRAKFLSLFTRLEGQTQQMHPNMKYTALLASVYLQMASELSVAGEQKDAVIFGQSVGAWPAFSDSVLALQRLSKNYKLVVLSNVDMEAFSKTLAGPLKGTQFDAVYTAEMIGSYKPDPKNFEYLLKHCEREFAATKDQVLHTAQALWHDHVPATKAGMSCAWITRQNDIEPTVIGGKLEDLADRVNLTFTFNNMKEIADAADDSFGVIKQR